MDLNIIYTQSRALLSKKPYSSWREIQDEFPDYQTSLGPWPAAQVVEFLEDEYPDLDPAGADQVQRFLAAASVVWELTFARGK